MGTWLSRFNLWANWSMRLGNDQSAGREPGRELAGARSLRPSANARHGPAPAADPSRCLRGPGRGADHHRALDRLLDPDSRSPSPASSSRSPTGACDKVEKPEYGIFAAWTASVVIIAVCILLGGRGRAALAVLVRDPGRDAERSLLLPRDRPRGRDRAGAADHRRLPDRSEHHRRDPAAAGHARGAGDRRRHLLHRADALRPRAPRQGRDRSAHRDAQPQGARGPGARAAPAVRDRRGADRADRHRHRPLQAGQRHRRPCGRRRRPHRRRLHHPQGPARLRARLPARRRGVPRPPARRRRGADDAPREADLRGRVPHALHPQHRRSRSAAASPSPLPARSSTTASCSTARTPRCTRRSTAAATGCTAPVARTTSASRPWPRRRMGRRSTDGEAELLTAVSGGGDSKKA